MVPLSSQLLLYLEGSDLMKKILLAVLALTLLLSACGGPADEGTPTPTSEPSPAKTAEPTSTPEPTPSGPSVYTDWSKLEPYEPRAAVYTRRYESFTDMLVPGEDYGPLLPFAGGKLVGVSEWSYGQGNYETFDLYGLVTLEGEVVVDPVFTSAFYLEEYDGGNVVGRTNVMLLGKVFYDGEGRPEERYALCAGDGSWCTGFHYRYDWEAYMNFSFAQGIPMLTKDKKSLVFLDTETGEALRTLDLEANGKGTDYEINSFRVDSETGWTAVNLYYWKDSEEWEYTPIPLLFDPQGNAHPLPGDVWSVEAYGDGLVSALSRRAEDPSVPYRYGYVDALTGAWAIEPVYSQANAFVNGVAPVSDRSGVWFIDTSGKRVTDNYVAESGSMEMPTLHGEYWYVTENFSRIQGILDQNMTAVENPLAVVDSHSFLPDGWVCGKTSANSVLARGDEVRFFPGEYGSLSNVRGNRAFFENGSWQDNAAVLTVTDLEGKQVVRLEGYSYGALCTDAITGEGYISAYAYEGETTWNDLYDLNGELLMKKARNGVLQGGLICTSEEDCTTLTDREGNVVFRWLVHSAQD